MNKVMLELITNGIGETLYMTLTSTVIAYILGIPLGVLIYITGKDGICRNRIINFIAGVLINIVRSVPFLILVVAIIPFTRMVVGTSIGSTATIVPLVVAATPFVARMVESSLREVDEGVVEAAKAIGASRMQI